MAVARDKLTLAVFDECEGAEAPGPDQGLEIDNIQVAMLEDLRIFVSAVVLNHTVPFLAGVGGVVLAVISHTSKRSRKYATQLFWTFAIVTMFYAGFAE